MLTCLEEWRGAHRRPTTLSSRSRARRAADALLSLRTRDEWHRFVRDLCTLPELRRSRTAGRPRCSWTRGPVRRDRRTGSDLDRDGHAGRAVAAPRHRWLCRSPSSGTSKRRGARVSLAVHERRPMGASPSQSPRRAAWRSRPSGSRRRGPVVRGDGAIARRPVRERPVDLLLVRTEDIPEYAQDGVVHLGITGANLVAETEAEVVTLAELGFGRCTPRAAVPVDVGVARRPTSRGSASRRPTPYRPGGCSRSVESRASSFPSRLGRGGAASGSGRRDRRSRLDGLDSERERPSSCRGSPRLPGGARRRARSGRASAGGRAARAHALRRRRGSPAALRDDERDGRGPARDPRRPPRAWARRPSSNSRRRARSPSTPPSTRTTSGHCCPRSRRQAHPPSSSSQSRGSCREKRSHRRRTRGRGADRGGCPRPRGRRPCRMDGRFDGARPERDPCRPGADRRGPGRDRGARRAATDDRGGSLFNDAQRPRDTAVEAAPGVVSERRWLPLEAVGLCVPSGRAPLPSSP